MVLPSGETRVSNLQKGHRLSSNSTEFDCLAQTGYAGTATAMGNDEIAISVSALKQTDVGSTDPRLVRNVKVRSDDELHRKETLNNFSTESVGRSGETDVLRADEFRGRDQGCRSNPLVGHFVRACVLRDTSPSVSAGYDIHRSSCEIQSKTSENKMRCSSNGSDGQESLLSTQSGLATPNDDNDSRSASIADCNDIFLDVSDASLSFEERPNPSPLEPDPAVRSPIIVRDCAARGFQKVDKLCRGTVNDSAKESLHVRKMPEDVGGDFDVFNIETTLPYMDWDYLEEQLQKAIEKEEMSQSQRNDREKIRQKLAMGLDDEQFVAGDRLFKKPSLQARFHSAMNLQMCFVNEASNEGAESGSDVEKTETQTSRDISRRELSSNSLFHSMSSSSSLASSKSSLQSATVATVAPPVVGNGSLEEDLDFFTRQARLQAEARLALAQVRPMAHMQLQLEKQTRRKSPIADIVGIPGFGDGKTGRLTRQLFQRMNLGQLQVVVNDMHTQIEAFNTELMELLIERDDLHMAQDSMLVDIEDLTRRAQEYDLRMKSKLVGSQNSC